MKMKDFDISMTQYKAGDIITGTIVLIGQKDVVVAIGGLKEGAFPREELDAEFKIGDAILVMVTGEINENGLLVLTHKNINKAIEDKEKLNQLKVGSELEFNVSEIIGSGLVGNFMGYRVFLPFSQCSTTDYVERNNLKDKQVKAIVIELNNQKKSIVCSTKILNQQDFEPVEIGQVINGTVIKLEDKYAIALLKNGSKAKLSITDATFTRINSLNEVVELDKEYEFKVIDVNADCSRVAVTLKHNLTDPRDEMFNQLNVGDEVEGVVVKILPVGAVIKLDNGLTALAITKENSDRANVATHHLYKLNSKVKGVISNLNPESKKINILTNIKKETE